MRHKVIKRQLALIMIVAVVFMTLPVQIFAFATESISKDSSVIEFVEEGMEDDLSSESEIELETVHDIIEIGNISSGYESIYVKIPARATLIMTFPDLDEEKIDLGFALNDSIFEDNIIIVNGSDSFTMHIQSGIRMIVAFKDQLTGESFEGVQLGHTNDKDYLQVSGPYEVYSGYKLDGTNPLNYITSWKSPSNGYNLWINADDAFDAYINGDFVGTGANLGAVYKYTVDTEEENLLAAFVEDRDYYGNMAGFKLILEESNNQFVGTDDTWYYRLTEPADYVVNDQTYKWYEKGYKGEGWLPVTEIDAPFDYWPTAWPTNEFEWIYSDEYSENSDKEVYLRSGQVLEDNPPQIEAPDVQLLQSSIPWDVYTGASASDDEDEDDPALVVKQDEEIITTLDISVIGTYTLMYYATDSQGQTTEHERVVKVVKAFIEGPDEKDVSTEGHTLYIGDAVPGAEEVDLNFAPEGDYDEVEWKLVDSDGNELTENPGVIALEVSNDIATVTAVAKGTQWIKVIADDSDAMGLIEVLTNNLPVITMNPIPDTDPAEIDVTVLHLSDYNDPGAVAEDEEDGIENIPLGSDLDNGKLITSMIVKNSDDETILLADITDELGTYTIIYSVVDTMGNDDSKERTVEVVPIPIEEIKIMYGEVNIVVEGLNMLIGNNPVPVNGLADLEAVFQPVGDFPPYGEGEWTLPDNEGFIVFDDKDEGVIKAENGGTERIKYTVDETLNEGVLSAEANVTVYTNNSPWISLNGVTPDYVYLNDSYTDPGTTYGDEETSHGNLIYDVVVKDSEGYLVNMSSFTDTIGVYTITYTVTDDVQYLLDAGFVVEPNSNFVTRTVHVNDNFPPMIDVSDEEFYQSFTPFDVSVTVQNVENPTGFDVTDPEGDLPINVEIKLVTMVGGATLLSDIPGNLLNVEVPGEYTIRYLLTDSLGNEYKAGDIVGYDRTINVLKYDAPVVTILPDDMWIIGSTEVSIEVASTPDYTLYYAMDTDVLVDEYPGEFDIFDDTIVYARAINVFGTPSELVMQEYKKPYVYITDETSADVTSNGVQLRYGHDVPEIEGYEDLGHTMVPHDLVTVGDPVWSIKTGYESIVDLTSDGRVSYENEGVAYVIVTVEYIVGYQDVIETDYEQIPITEIMSGEARVDVDYVPAPPDDDDDDDDDGGGDSDPDPRVVISKDPVELEYGTEADEDLFSDDVDARVYNSDDDDVTWSIDDDTVATVDQNGVVTAVKQGETTLRVEHDDSGATDSATVIVFLVGDEINPLGLVEFYDPYVFGYPDQTFRPGNDVTRAEVATMFAKILKLNLDYPGSQKFIDVNSEQWYYNYVQAIQRTSIFVGDPSGKFRPDDPISRAEMATVFGKFWEYLETSVDRTQVEITDVDGTHWASKYIYMMYNAGIVVGFEDGSYRPDDATLREQVVIMINTLIERPEFKAPFSKFTDIDSGHWAFGDIEAASQPFANQENIPVPE